MSARPRRWHQNPWWGLRQDLGHAQTMAFVTLALAQIWHLGNARSAASVLHPRHVVANRYALAAVVLSVSLQVASIHVRPLATVLDVVPLDAGEWLVVLGVSAVPAVVGQLLKLWRVGRRRYAAVAGGLRGD